MVKKLLSTCLVWQQVVLLLLKSTKATDATDDKNIAEVGTKIW